MSGAASDHFAWLKDIWLPVVTFILGFVISRLTLTKKERKEVEQANYDNTASLIEQHEAAYTDYTDAIARYVDAPSASPENFVEIATTGDRYFIRLNFLATSILSDKVDVVAREQILLPKVRAAVARSLPQHYGTLRSIADRHGFPYRGELRRTDYGAIYDVAEKYGPGPEWEDPLEA